MATNPMQKKARNSMLIGIILGLIFGCIGIAYFFMQANNYKKQLDENQANTRVAYVLKNDIESGNSISITDIEKVSVLKDVIPSDYITEDDITENTIAKINLKKGVVLSESMIQESDAKVTDDLREQQYNMIVLPQYLEIDNYIDIRLTLPSGQDYIVVSKKKIKNMSDDTIWIDMYEEETLTMNSAIVEAYKISGAKLYATIYVEPGIQADASPTYRPSSEVITLMNANSNIVLEAKQKLAERYQKLDREAINSQLEANADSAQSNLESKMEEEITKSKEARQEYIDSLNAGL
jgi:hypothetical protein